jgi:hypothetical protein
MRGVGYTVDKKELWKMSVDCAKHCVCVRLGVPKLFWGVGW